MVFCYWTSFFLICLNYFFFFYYSSKSFYIRCFLTIIFYLFSYFLIYSCVASISLTHKVYSLAKLTFYDVIYLILYIRLLLFIKKTYICLPSKMNCSLVKFFKYSGWLTSRCSHNKSLTILEIKTIINSWIYMPP